MLEALDRDVQLPALPHDLGVFALAMELGGADARGRFSCMATHRMAEEHMREIEARMRLSP